MGQYYKPVILNQDKKSPLGYFYSHDFGSGLKLMEHSWMDNSFVAQVEKAILHNPLPIVWAGDYADNEDVKNIRKDLLEKVIAEYGEEDRAELEKDGVNLYQLAGVLGIKFTHDVYFKKDEDAHSYNFGRTPNRCKYLVNHDKKEFVDKSKTPRGTANWMGGDGWRIHPLPLLTCEGNGRGGGDFHEDENNGDLGLIGSWARNVISLESRKTDIPKGFKEITFDLIES